ADPYYSLPKIDVCIRDLTQITDLAWQAVQAQNNADPYLFQLGREMVRLDFNEDEDGQMAPALSSLTYQTARYELARVANWIRTDNKGNQYDDRPPNDVVQDFLSTHNAPLPILSRIVEVPVFSRNGELITEPGYNQKTRCYYSQQAG